MSADEKRNRKNELARIRRANGKNSVTDTEMPEPNSVPEPEPEFLPTAVPTATPTMTPTALPATSTPTPTPLPATATPTPGPATATPVPTATPSAYSYNYSISAIDIAAATGNTLTSNNNAVFAITTQDETGNPATRKFTSPGSSFIHWICSAAGVTPSFGYYKDNVFVTSGLLSTQTRAGAC